MFGAKLSCLKRPILRKSGRGFLATSSWLPSVTAKGLIWRFAVGASHYINLAKCKTGVWDSVTEGASTIRTNDHFRVGEIQRYLC